MSTPFLTLQELKARGWTLGMIRSLLGAHDHERSTNVLGYQMAMPIRLYSETRVIQLEATEEFLHAQAQAQVRQLRMLKASQTRRTWQAEAVARYDALPLPIVQIHPTEVPGTAATQQAIWELHSRLFYLWQVEQDHLLAGVVQALRGPAERRKLQRYRATVYQAYGWRDSDQQDTELDRTYPP